MIPAFLAIAWLLGIAAASFTGAEASASLAAAGLLGVISFAVRPRWTTLALIAAGSVFIFAATWRYESTTPEHSPIARFNDGDSVRLRAIISDEPDDRGSSRLYRMDVQESYSEGGWRPDSGGLLMRTSLFPKYEYGDLLEIQGKLETPPSFDDFDYRDYLFRRGVDSIAQYPKVRVLDHRRGDSLRSTLIDFRRSLSGALSEVLPDPEATLATGILFGARANIPHDLNEDMQATGTSHLVAVSGQNVVLVAAFVIAALAWILGRRPAAWTALAAVILYALLVGGQPSVVRAAIMGGLYVLAHAPLAHRHLRLLLLSTWGYSRDNLAQVCEVVPETMRALLARIRRRAEPFLVSNSFADSHKALRQFRWRVDVRGEDRTAWRRTATLRVRSQAAKQPSHVVKHARPARGVS